MKFLIALPIIFVFIAILEVGNFTKSKLLIKISKIILIIATIFFVIGYLKYINFDISNINLI